MIKVAILGYGTVGSGVFEIINENKELITANAGEEIDVKYVLDLREFPGDSCESVLVHDYNIILNDPEVEVVIEVMGGLKPAYDFVKSALLAKKSVCTSNKELVAKYGAELIKIAQSNNRNFLFEAAVGGGIPIIRPMNMHITADKICEITGILNGTTNYILTKMDKEGADFDSTLKKAQELGYAERNPEADIEGYDAVRKIAILASLANGKTVNFEEIYTEGISKITAEDFKYAKKMGRSIKLLGKCKNEDTGIVCSVAPRLLAPDHPLYNVSGVTNGILVRGNMVGDLVFIGSGAGKLPTASAVVSDVVDSVRHLNVSTTVMWKEEKLQLEDKADSKRRFFVRIKGDKEKLIPQLKESYGEIEVVNVPELEDEFGFVTPVMMEGDYETRSKLYKEQIVHMIRIQD